MGATELRVGAAAHGSALATLGLRLAVEERDAWAVLRLLDRWRGASLGLARAADDPTFGADLAALRAAMSRLQQAVGDDDDDPVAARRAVAEIESRIRARARHLPGAQPGRRLGVDSSALEAELGPAALVVHFELDGRLGAVTVSRGEAELHADLGLSGREASELIGAALFALRRLTRPGGPAASRRAAAKSLADAMERLDSALVAPLVDSTAPLVVCPTGALHALPWSGLASCATRPVSVVPSLATLRGPVGVAAARARSGTGGRQLVALVAGPRLEGALAELSALAELHPRARIFDAADSRVDDVVAALDQVDIAHLACHGRFRTDNPMFSSLELADGPLTVFDLEQLGRPPAVVVLAACDVGSAAVGAGDELLGLTVALHRAGTRHVIASLVPVPDAAVVAFMVDLHRALLAGRSPAEALAVARQGVAGDEELASGLRAAFTCFGPP